VYERDEKIVTSISLKIRKNILMVVDNLELGGLQKVAVQVAELLAEEHNVTIYSYNMRDAVYSSTLGIISVDNNKKKNFFSKSIFRPIKYIFARKNLSNVLKELHIDTIILNSSTILEAPYLRRTHKKLNVIGWCHNAYDTYKNNYYKKIWFLFKRGLEACSRVVALTNIDRDLYKIHNQNTVAIPNIITIKNDEKKISNLENHIISFVGRIDVKMKGIDYLLQIAKKLPDDWKIVLAGDFRDDNNKAEFYHLTKEYNVNKEIHFKGALYGEDLANHFLESSIFIMTSRWEGFPLVVAEAMNFGLPVVAFENNGTKTILDNGKYGVLINVGDVDQMLVALTELTSDINRRKEYQEKSLDRLSFFDKYNIFELWQNIIVKSN
jgi:glycosyltransferase involved in cell wall biosynthesis